MLPDANFSSAILSSNSSTLLIPLISSGVSSRHWAVNSPRKALARTDYVKFLASSNAASVFCSIPLAKVKGPSTRRMISACSSIDGSAITKSFDILPSNEYSADLTAPLLAHPRRPHLPGFNLFQPLTLLKTVYHLKSNFRYTDRYPVSCDMPTDTIRYYENKKRTEFRVSS